MASDIQPGAYVRAIGGMYAGATGRVVSIGQSASGPYASVDVGDGPCIGVYLSALELVGEAPGASMSEVVAEANFALDMVTAERDRMREGVAALAAAVAQTMARDAELVETGGENAWCHEYAHLTLSEVAEALRVILAG